MARDYSLTCGLCGTEIHGKTEEELIENFKQHAHSHHDTEMSDEQVRQMMQKEQARR